MKSLELFLKLNRIQNLPIIYINIGSLYNFKEEFVTAGGVDLTEVNLATFESRRFAGLYFAGEVLDIDALTGGFNFQACWSAGWIISNAIHHKVLQGESLKISTSGS